MSNDKGVRLLLIGPPGSGKGTQAKHLTERYRVPHISTGDMLREQIRKGSALGDEAASYINEGNLVPDELILSMLKVRLSQSDTEGGYVLDGFPRSSAQADALPSPCPRARAPSRSGQSQGSLWRLRWRAWYSAGWLRRA